MSHRGVDFSRRTQTNALFICTEAINDMNPGVKIGEEGVKTLLSSLHSIRERARSKSILSTSLSPKEFPTD